MLWKPPGLARPSRRGVLRAGLTAGAAGAAGLLTPGTARASVSASDRKFVFVFACGGWDPTRVLADGFEHTIVDMEPGSERADTAGLSWIDAASRPSVRTFFERYADRTAMVHGLLVPSIAHESCFVLAYTGSSSDTGTDWPAILGAAGMERYAAPTLVLGGPTFPGVNLPAVVQTGGSGQLSDLMDGSYHTWSETAGVTASADSRTLLDTFVRERGRRMEAAAKSVARRDMASAFGIACDQAERLRARSDTLTFGDITNLDDAFTIATMALGQGVARCVSVCSPVNGERGWDSHVTNDDLQNVLFEQLYAGLLTLFSQLESTPGEVAATLLEETTVIVFSEMGRTPWINAQGGKDHWPYTSAMLVGSGIRGGVTLGAYDEAWYGMPVDFDSGDVHESGETVSCTALGATLLALGDVDPAEYTGDVGAIGALMA